MEERFRPPKRISEPERYRLLGRLRDLLRRYPSIRFAYVFGSFAREEPFRDVDVAIHSTELDPLRELPVMRYELRRETGQRIDLVLLDRVPIALQHAVFREGVLLFCRHARTRAQFIEKVSRRYITFKHFRNLFAESLRG